MLDAGQSSFCVIHRLEYKQCADRMNTASLHVFPFLISDSTEEAQMLAAVASQITLQALTKHKILDPATWVE